MQLKVFFALFIFIVGEAGSKASPQHSSSELGIINFKMPPTKKGGPINITINTSKTGKISPYIYGFGAVSGDPLLWDPANRFSLFRLGGNRFTAYNWENNMSHAGSDWRYQNDTYLCGNIAPIVTPKDCEQVGGVIKGFAEHSFGLQGSKQNASILVTIPIIGYVAFEATDGDVCPGEFVQKDMECKTRSYLETKFRKSRAKGPPATGGQPDLKDAYVNQNEFVKWLYTSFPEKIRKDREIFFSLDNEPALWGMTHNRLRPGGKYCVHNPSYTEIINRNLEYANMIKEINPKAVVFGPVDYGWYSMTRFQGFDQCDENSGKNFHEVYLSAMRKAAKDSPTKASPVDILDIHWYSEIQPKEGIKITEKHAPETLDYIRARLDAPRSLWDPEYIEDSWIAEKDLGQKPIRLIPRMREMIRKFNPGMGISISEYTFGGENHISGGLAQMDALGIMGREGVFAATFWPLAEKSDYIYGAFRMFTNFDGKNGRFGEDALEATSSDASRVSVYASLDPQNSESLILIVINKSQATQDLTFEILNRKAPIKTATIYALDKSSPVPQKKKILSDLEFSKFKAEAMTGYTIVLR